jgi:hypothetical protein
MTTNDVDRIETEIAQCKDALRSPRIGLFESRRLFRRLESLYRELDRLEIDLAINHVNGEPDEKELSSRSTVYRNG